MIKLNRKSEKSTKSTTQRTDTWTNFIKFSSIFVICLALTLAGVKIPAKADDYWLRWYTSTQNPITGTYSNNPTNTFSSIDNAYQVTLSTYGYVDWLIGYTFSFAFTGYTNGYTYKYRPAANLQFNIGQTFPITNFNLDSVTIDSYSWSGQFTKITVLDNHKSITPRYNCPFTITFDQDFQTMYGDTTAKIDIVFRVRAYCSDANAVSLNYLGQSSLLGTIGQYGSSAIFVQGGAWIANYSPLQLDLAQYQQFLIANNYLDSIATALAPSYPPDPVVNEAETKASEAEELQEEEESLQAELESYFDENALDDVFEDEIEPMFQDAGIGAGLVFWKDWVNHHFNKGYNDGEHFSSTLSIVFNIMARLWK